MERLTAAKIKTVKVNPLNRSDPLIPKARNKKNKIINGPDSLI